MRSLSKDAERKLISAIEKAAALVNDGAAPTDAIIKSAREHDIPAGHINLMVHAYNTGRTTTQREKSDSTLEKAADFPLADVNDVLKALYPETVKSSSAIKRAEVVSTEYALPVAGMLARRKDEMQKSAAAKVALPEKTWTPPPRDEHAAVVRSQSQKMAAHRAEEETRRQATAAYSKAATALDDLNVYFRTPGNMSFGDALREVNLRFGVQGVSVLQKVAAVYPHFTKQADTNKKHFGDDAVYGLVQNVLDSVGAYNAAQAKTSSKKAEAVGKKTAPEFLTGSILAEKVEEPLTLKSAAKKPPNYIGGDKNFQQEFADRLGIPNVSPDYVRSQAHKLDAAERERARFENMGKKLVPETPAEAFAREEQEADNAKLQDALFNQREVNRVQQERDESTHRQMQEEDAAKMQADDEKLQDALFNQNENNRVQQERDMQYARKLREEDLTAEQAEAARLMDEEFQQKEIAKKQDEFKTKVKGISGDFGKAVKDLAPKMDTPIKFVGGLLGAKNLSDLSPIKDTDSKKVVREQYQKLMDPTHENALKTIRAKSVLHDMVLNDSVISGYDPQDVAMAFNEIAELAPSLIDAPGMIRPLLRKRLESGQLADFDVKQILEMDKLRADRDKAIGEIKDRNLNLL